MAVYYPGCNTTLPQPGCSDCPTKELGDVRSVAFIDSRNFTFTDIGSSAQWATAIAQGYAWIIPKTNGTLELAETLEPGFGNTLEMLDSYTFTLVYKDPNFKIAYPFYNQAKNTNYLKVVIRTETQVYISDATVTIIPKQNIVEGKTARVLWEVTVKWLQEDLLQPVNMPTGVFDQCVVS